MTQYTWKILKMNKLKRRRLCRLALVVGVVVVASLILEKFASAPRDYVETLDPQWERHLQLPVDSSRDRLMKTDINTRGSRGDAITRDGFVLPRRFTYTINNLRNICERANYSLFVYVHSAIENFERRTMLRETWANRASLQKHNVGFVFMIGKTATANPIAEKTLERENGEFNDIVQIDYVDAYKKISVKSAASLNWAALNCARYVHYVLKIDDDMFVDLDLLMRFLRDKVPSLRQRYDYRPLLMCNVKRYDQIVRNKSSPWHIPWEFYGKTHYPPFCPGSALLMTSSAVSILRVALNGSRLFPLDDVWITAILRHNTGVELVPINEHYAPDAKGDLYLENFSTTVLFAHCSLKNLQILWDWIK